MRLSLVLVLALGCLAAAGPHDGPHGDDGPHDRPRRFLLGWDRADSFFHNVAAEIRRTWAASARWAKHLFAWARHHPEHSTVYRVRLPHGTGIVAIIDHRGGQRHHHGAHHYNALIWDGKQLAWENAGNGSRADGTITVRHAHANETLPLAALAKYLSHVAAGSKIQVDIRGSSWHNLRIVLRVVGKHGEDQTKSVSVLLSTVLKEIKQHSHSSSEKSSSSHEKSSASSKLSWDGHALAWANVSKGQGKHIRRQLRVSQGGESHVIPFSVLAKHLKTVAAGSQISFEVTGHTLKDLRVLLHVLHGGKKQTISLLVSKLAQEAEASKHGASAKKPGRVVSRVEVKHDKEGKKKAVEAVPAVQTV